MRRWRLATQAALLAGMLGFLGAGMSALAAANDADPAKALVEPTDKLLVVGGGLLVLVLAAIGLTITFRSLLGDLRKRRNRYRRRAKREPRRT